MYECEECDSTVFVQVVKQQETVHSDGAGGVESIDVNGRPEVLDLKCGECGAEVEFDD